MGAFEVVVGMYQLGGFFELGTGVRDVKVPCRSFKSPVHDDVEECNIDTHINRSRPFWQYRLWMFYFFIIELYVLLTFSLRKWNVCTPTR